MTSQKNYLDQVIRLLDEGSELKLLYGCTDFAKKKFEEAIALIEEDGNIHNIPKVFHALAQYRLAHVLFRTAATPDDYDEIDRLLASACRKDCLGPLPRLYRLAVMSLIGASAESIQKVFDPLLTKIEKFTENTISLGDKEGTTAIQNSLFNMLEIVIYLSRISYQKLEGQGRIDNQYFDSKISDIVKNNSYFETRRTYSDLYSSIGNWRLVGTIPGLSTRSYPGEIALDELEERMEKGEVKPPCICFHISKDGPYNHINIDCTKNKDGSFYWFEETQNSDLLRYIAAISDADITVRFNNLKNMFNNNTEDYNTSIRQVKSRAKKKIEMYFENQYMGNQKFLPKKIFIDERMSKDTAFIPKLGFNVLGAIENNLYLQY